MATVPWYILCLIMMFLALQTVSGALHIPCLIIMFLAFQTVSGHCALPYYISNHDVFGSSECEWLLCLAIFHACSWFLFLTFQEVSSHYSHMSYRL